MKSKKLIDEINAQRVLIEELIQAFERETAEMSSVNISAMNTTNLIKEELITKISAQSQRLQQAISDTAASEGLPNSATLGKLVEHLAKKGDKELQKLQKQLNSRVDKLNNLADLNKAIAERFASTVNTSLNYITKLINQSNVYGRSGVYQQRLTGAVMINREA